MSESAMIIVPTDISEKMREIEQAYNRYLTEFRIPEDHRIVVNYSAGKDSTATLAVAHALFGDKAQGVMADTDNEHELTIEFGKTIHEQIGCSPIKVVKRIYTENDFAKRRAYLQKNWPKRQVIRMGAYRGIVMPSLARHVQLYGLEPDVQHIDWSGFYGPRANLNAPGVDEVVEWAKTGRGGKVYDLVKASLDTEVCSSRYGLCE